MDKSYKDKALSPEERARDLLGRMSTGQKLGQMMCRMINGTPSEALEEYPHGVGEAIVNGRRNGPGEVAKANREAIDAIMEKTGGIPPIIHVEAVTGMVSTGTTTFPSAIGLGATFDVELVEKMSAIIRGQMLSTGVRRALSPVMDIARDPRWGRVAETYGEDATLCAAMSVAFTKGLNGEDLENGVAATGKHFLGYAMGEAGLNGGSSSISPRDLQEVYAKPFQAAITEAGLQTVMNSYGAPDNEPVVASKRIFKRLLRDEMKFKGITVSDYGAVEQLIDKRLAADEKEAGVRALKAGLDLELPNAPAYLKLEQALSEGLITMEEIDAAVLRILTLKFRMGLFENPYPREEMLSEAYQAPANREHSLKAAHESTVLLKNDGILPLSKEKKKIAVIGPRADNVRMQYGGYTFPAGLEMAMGGLLKGVGIGFGGESDEYYPGSNVKKESPQLVQMLNGMLGQVTPNVLGAIRAKCQDAEVAYEKGCDIAGNDKSGFAAAEALARRSDIVILAVGGKYGWGEPCTAGEGRDTSDIGLPGVQEELLQTLCETGAPVIVVHGDVRPISSKYAKEHAAAILETWCPGQSGGAAVADILFGDYNPAGRLPVTALEHVGQVPMYMAQKRGNLLDMSQESGEFNSFSNGIQKPLWHFGEGFGYTTFAYSDFHVDPVAAPDGEIHAEVTVKNVGERDGEEVVQLYFTDEAASMIRPGQELAGFARISLKAGEGKVVKFTMKASQTAFLNEDMEWVVEKGDVSFRVGSSSIDVRGEGVCRISDTMVVDGATRGFYAKAEY